MSNNCHISWSKLDQLILKADTILLSTHIHSDGDGIGSELAFYQYLVDLGKECRIINPSEIPNKLKFLDSCNKVETFNSVHVNWLNNVDLSIIFDIGDYKRLKEISNYLHNSKTVSIDHHPSKSCNFFDYKIIDSNSPATGFMLWEYFYYHLNMKELSKNISDALYTALATDTGFFRYSNTTAKSHTVAAHLIGCGTNPYEIYSQVHEQRNHSQVKLLAKVIQNLEFSDDGKFSWFTITQNMLNECDAILEDVDGFTNFSRSINGVEIAVMFVEVDKHTTRINFRSKGQYSINDIAIRLGGGGHQFAAGALVKERDLQEVKLNTISLVKQKLSEKK
ncbi:MAG: bifunctional oligoribonuclease/PAP phosphatase NrnA [Candidatus Marinimicrobia bacterium]|nr:bifunctional oligoribonuclease/PAP phosphatase NrnA [Candidatus Neomarinimicrobiota bacterium]MBL7022726.1 bifunctional oligoribonuclease/PAP phosphatase NrnA [Candidatus Neomarinimicrobiota bacterium]MBL7109145.1 bifunctional oligoribonuclease/PAP phosphatase NrnA [Candidatus Neomarinimicrobiota bacterium]